MSKWNLLDKFIATLRYKKVKKYIVPNKAVLDVGCGQEASFLKSIMDGQKLCIGIDRYINNYKDDKLLLKKIDIVKDLHKIKTKVDVVTMLAFIEHIDDVDAVLKNITKIANDGCKIVLTTPTRFAKPVLEFLAFKLKIINADEIREHKHYYVREEIKKLLENNNMKELVYKKFLFGFNQIVVAQYMNNRGEKDE